jgi:hypothetical protein
MKKDAGKNVNQEDINKDKTQAGTGKKDAKKKVTAASINKVIQPATSKVRANSSGSHLDDGTWVDYEDENK